ncbi:MAG: hypothetical protein R3F59_32845 [Myxococcota bacterium]
MSGALLALALSARGAAAARGACTFTVDGQPAPAALDCAARGAWAVRCTLPEGISGKLRVWAELPDRHLAGEARLPLGDRTVIDLPISGPGGRAGAFVVDAPTGTLLPGQALGPNDWCPVVQPTSPRARPGRGSAADRRQRPRADGLRRGGDGRGRDEPRPRLRPRGGDRVRADPGTVQRPVGTVPVLAGPLPPTSEDVRGQLTLLGDGASHSVGWSGRSASSPPTRATMHLLLVDFVTPEVAAAAGGDPVAWLQADLDRWLAGDDSAPLGLVGWARSDVRRPVTLSWTQAGAWRTGTAAHEDVRIGQLGDRLRVAIAWRLGPWDPPSRRALDAAIAGE